MINISIYNFIFGKGEGKQPNTLTLTLSKMWSGLGRRWAKMSDMKIAVIATSNQWKNHWEKPTSVCVELTIEEAKQPLYTNHAAKLEQTHWLTENKRSPYELSPVLDNLHQLIIANNKHKEKGIKFLFAGKYFLYAFPLRWTKPKKGANISLSSVYRNKIQTQVWDNG